MSLLSRWSNDGLGRRNPWVGWSRGHATPCDATRGDTPQDPRDKTPHQLSQQADVIAPYDKTCTSVTMRSHAGNNPSDSNAAADQPMPKQRSPPALTHQRCTL